MCFYNVIMIIEVKQDIIIAKTLLLFAPKLNSK